MEELIIEWTLVRRPSFVEDKFIICYSSKLGSLKIRLLREQFADDNGRVDLIYESGDKQHIFLVELESSLVGKYDFCLEQTKRYKNMASHFAGKQIHTVILYAKDQTPDTLRTRLKADCGRENIDIIEYDIVDVQKIYDEEIQILSKNIGLEMVDIRTDMPYTLSGVNRFMLAFKTKPTMNNKEIGAALPTSKGTNKGKAWSQTSVVQHSYLAEGIGLVTRTKNRGKVLFSISEVGKEFLEKMDTYGMDLSKLETISSSIPLSVDQKRIIISQLLKDNFMEIPRYKAMILLFLRFLSITRGIWVPKQRTYKFTDGQVTMLNYILGTNWHNPTSMGNVLTWSRNYCKELGLIEVLKGERDGSERAVMTTLGSRIYSLLESTQSLKREIIHIPQQVS